MLPPAEARASATVTPIRVVLTDADEAARAQLVRRLAGDRLRDLRDDGVTVAYMARMYDVEPALMEEMVASLGPGTR